MSLAHLNAGSGTLAGSARAGEPPQNAAPVGPTRQPAAESSSSELRRRVLVEVFSKSDCRQCDSLLTFLEQLKKRRSDIAVKVYDVAQDQEALRRLHALCKQHKVAKPGLPGVLVCDQMFVGYRDDQTTGSQIEETLGIEVFTREGCPHCLAARRFLDELSSRTPGLKIVYRDVQKEPGQLKRMQTLAQRHRVQVANVPFFSLYGRVLVGFGSPESTGKQLTELIDTYCPLRSEPAEQAKPQPPATKEPVTENTSGSETPPASPKPSGRQESTDNRPAPVSNHASVSWTKGGLSGASRGLMSAVFGGLTQDPSGTTDPDAPPDPEPLPDLVEPLPDEMTVPGEAAQAEEGSDLPSPPDSVHVPILGDLSVSRLGLPLFTFLLGLIDGFNPCAMWVLIFLLSVLVNLKDRWKMAVIAGTFVFVSGLAYFAFMAAWLNVFLLIGFVRWAQILLGSLAVLMGVVHIKDFFAFKKGLTFSIPESAKPGIYDRVRRVVSAPTLWAALTGAIVLAVLVNIVELLCTAGLPAVYTQILMYRQFPWWKNYGYLAWYNLAYMLDDSIMVTIAVTTLSHRRLQEREGRWLKLISGVVILGLGLCLLLKPDWLI